MKEGLELDIEVVEKVFGYELCTKTFHSELDKLKTYYHVSGGDVFIVEYTGKRWWQYIFSPSTNMNDAWQVSVKLGLCLIPQSSGEGFRYYACDIESVSYRGEGIVIVPLEDSGYSAETAELAICLAALETIK